MCDPVSVDKPLSIDLSDLPDIQAWVHLTYAANHIPGTFDNITSYSYIRVDSLGFNKTVNGSYTPITKGKIFYGIGHDRKVGFKGDLRELYVTKGFSESSDEEAQEIIRHRSKVIDLNDLGYYKFDQSDFNWLNDDFRPQSGEVVYQKHISNIDKEEPKIIQDGKANFYCDYFSPTQYKVPRIFDVAGYWPEFSLKRHTQWDYIE